MAKKSVKFNDLPHDEKVDMFIQMLSGHEREIEIADYNSRKLGVK